MSVGPAALSTNASATIQDLLPPHYVAPGPGWSTSGVDGVVPGALDRVLLTAQTNAVDNGIWQVDVLGTTLARPADFAVGASAGANFVFVDGTGHANNDQGYLCTTPPGLDVIGTNTLTWVQYTSRGGNVGTLTKGTDSITTASGTLSFLNNNLTTTGTVSSTSASHGSLTLSAGHIYDSSGQVSFNTDNLVTSGTVQPGTLSLGAGSITDSSGAISLGSTNVTSTGTITSPHFLTSSDLRLKNVLGPLTPALDNLAKLHPVNFTWKDSGVRDTGLIAQDVQEVASECVRQDVNGMLAVDYACLVPYLVAWLQELLALIAKDGEARGSTV